MNSEFGTLYVQNDTRNILEHQHLFIYHVTTFD